MPQGELQATDRHMLPVEEADQDATQEAIEAEEECQPVNSLPTPGRPSQSEIDDHNVTHVPYRSWCSHCVEGRGREMAHTSVDRGDRSVATVAFDYLFMVQFGVYIREEWQVLETDEETRTGALKILVVRDLRSRALSAHGVPFKGVDEKGFSVQCLVDDIAWLGYTRILLRSDNEPAIVALLKESLKALRIEGVVEQASGEHPPPYDSQANGCIEIGVKSVRGHMRTLQVALQSTIGYKIPCRHPIMSWLASHAAGILTNFVRGSDGRTAYQRVRGKPFASKMIAVAERCRYKTRSKNSCRVRTVGTWAFIWVERG